jgi:transcription termination/antitermination protein NusG
VTQEKNVVKKRKKFHGYVFAEVEFNDRILYLFRETSGVGDFVGGGGVLKPPAPMAESEVRKMMGIHNPGDDPKRKVAVKLDFEKGDRVRVKDGAFSGSEAEVKLITMPKDPTDTPKVTVVVTIWGRPVEMEMDYWHVEKL